MITKPTLLLDERKCKANIATMATKAKKHNITLRPHFKTHQSLEIGRWFKEVGVSKITVSSLEMAAYFSAEWNNITVAFPINILEINTINLLAKKIQLNVLLDSVEAVEFLADNLFDSIGFFIKINIGNNRAGIDNESLAIIDAIIRSSQKSNFLNFLGFLGHAGQTYKCRSKSEILEVHRIAKEKLVLLKMKYLDNFTNLIASYGDTPSCSVAEDFKGLDEIRPGNYVFYDLMQVQIGACNYESIAVVMACPIASINKIKGELIIYGGGIHFSKDRMEDNDHGDIYGKVVSKDDWSELVPNMFIRGLSQEHGIVKVPTSHIDKFKIGDLLYILPVHSCMTADLMKAYKTLDNRQIYMLNSRVS
jgi:D-serine deaminase-like pyridoxal phosphate-dependent protein